MLESAWRRERERNKRVRMKEKVCACVTHFNPRTMGRKKSVQLNKFLDNCNYLFRSHDSLLWLLRPRGCLATQVVVGRHFCWHTRTHVHERKCDLGGSNTPHSITNRDKWQECWEEQRLYTIRVTIFAITFNVLSIQKPLVCICVKYSSPPIFLSCHIWLG